MANRKPYSPRAGNRHYQDLSPVKQMSKKIKTILVDDERLARQELKYLLQEYPDIQIIDAHLYEVIITDDGRQSTAEQMVKEQYPWVRWVKGPQRGPASNRNNGGTRATNLFLADWLE